MHTGIVDESGQGGVIFRSRWIVRCAAPPGIGDLTTATSVGTRYLTTGLGTLALNQRAIPGVVALLPWSLVWCHCSATNTVQTALLVVGVRG